MTINEFIFEDVISRIQVDGEYTRYGERILPPKIRIYFQQGTVLELRASSEDQVSQLTKLMMDRTPFEVKLVPK